MNSTHTRFKLRQRNTTFAGKHTYLALCDQIRIQRLLFICLQNTADTVDFRLVITIDRLFINCIRALERTTYHENGPEQHNQVGMKAPRKHSQRQDVECERPALERSASACPSQVLEGVLQIVSTPRRQALWKLSIFPPEGMQSTDRMTEETHNFGR
jgi:hypothetical protein